MLHYILIVSDSVLSIAVLRDVRTKPGIQEETALVRPHQLDTLGFGQGHCEDFIGGADDGRPSLLQVKLAENRPVFCGHTGLHKVYQHVPYPVAEGKPSPLNLKKYVFFSS